ncbi:MAG: alpha-E domain-containing protein [Bacteroidales bacterium]
MECNIITADKANRLYWLGRYTERIYLSLHLLRRYYDKVIDGDINDLKEYYECLSLEYSDEDLNNERVQLSQLYDPENVCSIISSINYASDNAIMLRRDITSESLSYIQMSQVIIDECAAINEQNISKLQPITDYMLAFFGSIDERVFDTTIRRYIKVGKLIENLVLHVRFNYTYQRIAEAFELLKEYIKQDAAMYDHVVMQRLNDLITEKNYTVQADNYKITLLRNLNCLIWV